MAILVAQPDLRLGQIPEWVTDIDSFRRWAVSEDFPDAGWYGYLGGDLWVDTNMEVVGHNQIKGKIGSVLAMLIDDQSLGYYFFDRMLLTNKKANLSTEPDGMFVSTSAIKNGRAVLAKGSESKEVLGTPDMVLEVVSRTSVRKDRLILPGLYHRAGIAEYWLVENLAAGVTLDLLVSDSSGYIPVPKVDGWSTSRIFGREFRLTTMEVQANFPSFKLEMR